VADRFAAHGLVHGANAGVYVTEFTRRGVLEALQARRSFGATEKMVIDFRQNAQMLGHRTAANTNSRFDVVTQGLRPLKLVEVIRGNQVI